MNYETRCIKCGGVAYIVAREANHDASIIDIQIICQDKHCGATASSFLCDDLEIHEIKLNGQTPE